jgi:hypothetical protein
MTFTARGLDAWLEVIACLLFLLAAFAAYFGHRATITLIAVGLLLVTLTLLVS